MKLLKVLFLAATLMAGTVSAAWPEKDITIIVPYPPGGANDRIARQLSVSMEAILKKPVVVVYHPGGGNAIAISEMERMDPDYTFMLPNAEIVTGPASQGKDSYKNFHPVMIMATAPQMLYANPKVAKDDFVTRQKAGEQIQVAVPDLANPATIWINGIANVQNIPYKGGAQTVFAVTAKQVDYGVGTIANGWGALQGKQIVPVMLGDTKRSPLLPNVPTYQELGFKGRPNVLWFGLIASNRITPEVEKRVYRVAEFATETPEMKQLTTSGVAIQVRTQKESQDIYNTEIKNVKK
jgi:tripartite-type tricarboxylate transporter receptor subunit TctC